MFTPEPITVTAAEAFVRCLIREGVETTFGIASGYVSPFLDALRRAGIRVVTNLHEGAAAVAEVSMVSQRLAGVPMETNGCLMVPGEPSGGITCWISHQAPHSVQPVLAAVLGLEPGAVRVACPWVGGGFGPKAAGDVGYL